MSADEAGALLFVAREDANDAYLASQAIEEAEVRAAISQRSALIERACEEMGITLGTTRETPVTRR